MHVAVALLRFENGYEYEYITYNRALYIVAALIPMKMKMQASSTSTSTDLPHLCLLRFALFTTPEFTVTFLPVFPLPFPYATMFRLFI